MTFVIQVKLAATECDLDSAGLQALGVWRVTFALVERVKAQAGTRACIAVAGCIAALCILSDVQ